MLDIEMFSFILIHFSSFRICVANLVDATTGVAIKECKMVIHLHGELLLANGRCQNGIS